MPLDNTIIVTVTVSASFPLAHSPHKNKPKPRAALHQSMYRRLDSKLVMKVKKEHLISSPGASSQPNPPAGEEHGLFL